MSALAGLWNLDGKPGAGRECRRMLDAQRIYGPDASDLSDEGHVALGRNLYRIATHQRFDRQPLTGAGGRLLMVADARLDDREGLARALRLEAGLAELADSALVLAAWERWEERAFDHLHGDYAFALWDAGRQRLILARDAMGARPLHYHRGTDFVAFASMPKGLHALDAVPYAPDEQRAIEFLALLPERGPRSFFAGISRVEQGHFVSFTRDGMEVRRHWRPDPAPIRLRSADEYAEAMRHHLDRAVASRLRDVDGGVGAHLSAGLDSSAVAATAARLLAPGDRLTAFTHVPRAGYDGPAPPGAFGDESGHAAAVAALYPNIDHVLVHSDARTVLDDLDRNFHLFERPLPNAQVWQFWNQINGEAARRGVRVMLNGAAGNITSSYAGTHLLSELAAQHRYLKLWREGRALVRAGRARWIGVLGSAFGEHIPRGLWDRLYRWRRGVRPGIDSYTTIRPDRRGEAEALGAAQGFDTGYRQGGHAFAARLAGLHRIDIGNGQKGALAGYGIDLRDATMDRRLIEFCLAVPTGQYLAAGVPRALARNAFADRLPRTLLDERRRGMQVVDWHEGLTRDRERIREEIERLAQVPSAAETLDLERMRALVDAWPSGGWHVKQVEVDYCFALLRGVVSGQFLRKASRTNA
jgi:asparagine synthase (glutamine-hydrolysing)